MFELEKCCRTCKNFNKGKCLLATDIFYIKEQEIISYGDNFEKLKSNILRDIKRIIPVINSSELDDVSDSLDSFLYDVTLTNISFNDNIGGLDVVGYDEFIVLTTNRKEVLLLN